MLKINKNDGWYKNFLENQYDEKTIKVLSKRWREISRVTGIDKMSEIFEIDVASLISGKTYKKAYEEVVVIGTKDGGIDVVYENNNKWHFIQVKMKEYHKNYIQTMETQFHSYFSKPNVESDNSNSDLEKFKKIFNQKNRSDTKYEFIFIGLDDGKNGSVQDQFPEKKNIKYSAYSYKELLLMMTSGVQVEKNEVFTIHVPKVNQVIVNDNGAQDFKFDGILSIVDAEELMEQFIDLNEIEIDNIFNKNIRNKVVNKKFKDEFVNTIKNYKNYFHLFNNGITMVSEEVSDKSMNGKVEIKNPQIINGQQTFRTLLEIYKESKTLNGIKIPIKIIQETNDEIINLIAKNSNNQTKVNETELKFSTNEYSEVVKLAKSYGIKIKGKKGKRDMDEFVSVLSDNGELPFNEIIRAHSSMFYHTEYIGSSKNSISSVVNDYFNKNNINMYNSLIKRNNFKSVINVIKKYGNQIKIKREELVENYKNEGLKSKEYNKKINSDLNPYKYGISMYYYISHSMPNIDSFKALEYIYENPAKGNMNFYKNNSTAISAIKYIKENKEEFIKNFN